MKDFYSNSDNVLICIICHFIQSNMNQTNVILHIREVLDAL